MTETTKATMRDGIIKRGSTYSYVVRERDAETGKSKPRWFGGFATRKEAMAARNKARTAVDRGTYVAPKTMTVGEWLDLWVAGHAMVLKPSTRVTYQSKIDNYLKPTIGRERIQGLSPSRLSKLFRELGESGGKDGKPLSARSVEFARAVLRKAMQDAVVERLIEVNPVVGSKSPRRQGKPQHTTWTPVQQRAFLSSVEASRWATAWALALATGMRRGELCGLTWDRVDLDAKVLTVDRSTTQLGRDRVTTEPKNHENRKVALDPHTIATLRTWRTQQAAERLKWGPAYLDSESLMFTWENGAPVLPDYLSKLFVSEQSDLDLPRMTLHGTRHTHATTLLREGVPVHIVSKRLGHKDASITLNVYADVIPDDDDRAVDVFARAVWGA